MDTECISLARDIVVGVSALVVATVAFLGLRTWRRELTGKAKFDLARNTMLLALKLKADFEWARNPGGWSWEYAGRTWQESESPGVKEVLNQWYAKNQRLEPLVENLQKFQEVSWEAEIVLGEDSSKRVSEALAIYRRSYGELSSAIDSYFETRHEEAIGHDVSMHQDWLKELRKVIFSAKDDDFSKQIDKAIEQLAPALKTYVK